MRIPVCDVDHPDEVIAEFPVHPVLGRPGIGDRVRLQRRGSRPKWPWATVTEYVWDDSREMHEETRVKMMVQFLERRLDSY